MPLTTIYDGGTRIVGDATALEESLHPAVMAYVNTMRSPAGGNYAMTVNEIDAVNNMVKAMVANGIWSKMKAVYPVIGGTAAAHKYNLVDPRDADAAFRLSFLGGGWVHSSTGMTPNGTSSYANTFFNPSTQGLSINSTHISYYRRTTQTASGALMGAASISGPITRLILVPNFDAVGNGNISEIVSSGVQQNASAITSLGLITGSRISNTEFKLFANGQLVNTVTRTSSLQPNNSIWLAANNYFGGQGYTNNQCAFASIGNGLTNAEARAFYQIVQTYQTKLGRQV